jgi:hypothetical protein
MSSICNFEIWVVEEASFRFISDTSESAQASSMPEKNHQNIELLTAKCR